jgi:prefoldin beta subunit
LELLEEDGKVFKLIGPILIRQDLEDAKANVDKRLEFIKREL